MTSQPEALRAEQRVADETEPTALVIARLVQQSGFHIAASLLREQHEALEKKSYAIQRLRKERDQLRAALAAVVRTSGGLLQDEHYDIAILKAQRALLDSKP